MTRHHIIDTPKYNTTYLNKLHKLKNKTDDLCFLSLNKLKESIKD